MRKLTLTLFLAASTSVYALTGQAVVMLDEQKAPISKQRTMETLQIAQISGWPFNTGGGGPCNYCPKKNNDEDTDG